MVRFRRLKVDIYCNCLRSQERDKDVTTLRWRWRNCHPVYCRMFCERPVRWWRFGRRWQQRSDVDAGGSVQAGRTEARISPLAIVAPETGSALAAKRSIAAVTDVQTRSVVDARGALTGVERRTFLTRPTYAATRPTLSSALLLHVNSYCRIQLSNFRFH